MLGTKCLRLQRDPLEMELLMMLCVVRRMPYVLCRVSFVICPMSFDVNPFTIVMCFYLVCRASYVVSLMHKNYSK